VRRNTQGVIPLVPTQIDTDEINLNDYTLLPVSCVSCHRSVSVLLVMEPWVVGAFPKTPRLPAIVIP